MNDMRISDGASWVSNWSQSPEGEQSEVNPITAYLMDTKAQEEPKSLQERMAEAREKAEERRDRLTLRTNGAQYGDVAMIAYAKLARARNQGQVSMAAGYARRQIVRLQSAAQTDKDNAERIKAAIRQLQKAVGRAAKKKRELQREDLLQARQRKAALENQNRKVESLRHELGGRRTMRAIRETGYLREAEIDNRLQGQLAATRMELRQQAETLAAAVKPSLDAAIQEYQVQSDMAPMPVETTGVGNSIDLEV